VRRSSNDPRPITIACAGNGWILRIPDGRVPGSDAEVGLCDCPHALLAMRQRTRTLVFRNRDREAMIDVLDKACRQLRESALGDEQ
jgi:hypothetical protein